MLKIVKKAILPIILALLFILMLSCSNEAAGEVTPVDKWDREWEVDDGPMGDGEAILVWFVDSLIGGNFENENWWFNRNRCLTEELLTGLSSERLAEIRDEIFAAAGEFEFYGDIAFISDIENIEDGQIRSVITNHAYGIMIFTLYLNSDFKFTDFSFELESS